MMMRSETKPNKNDGNQGIPRHWYNIVPFMRDELHLDIPPLLDPKNGRKIDASALGAILPFELANQEMNSGQYSHQKHIEIPPQVLALYKNYRRTPLVRASGLEKLLGLNTVRIYYKREDASPINSYKLNSSYAQAYYAKQEGVNELVGDTGPGNWGLGMALACKEFGIPAVIYMEKSNYLKKIDKVRAMEILGAKVVPISTKEGTIAASLSKAIEHLKRNPKNKLSLGCLTAYSALHNTIIGQELEMQLREQDIQPDAIIGVVGGGSSFSGLVFPLIERYFSRLPEFIAVESARVPSFTKGEYRYENPDVVGLMPRAKMYTLGNGFVPENLGASGLNYHGKNPLLSLLVHKKIVRPIAYEPEQVDGLQEIFKQVEGILPSAEACYAIKGAIEHAKKWNGQNKTIIFSLTGNEEPLRVNTSKDINSQLEKLEVIP